MAWTTPSTWTTGSVLTASDLNAQLRDNMVDVGQPGCVFAIMGSSLSFGSSASETYPTSSRFTFSSLPLAKNVTVSGSKLTVSVAGIWEWSAGIMWPATASASASSVRAIKLYVNDAASAGRDMALNVQNVDTINTFGGYQVSMAANNWVDLRGWQNHGSSLSVQTDCWLCGKLIYRT